MPEFNVVQQDSIERPYVSDNMGRLNSQTFIFSETSFTKDYYDPMGGGYSTVTIKKIPSVLQLNYVVNPVTVGAEFEADDSYHLRMELHPKYAVHNAVLYEFRKDIDEIIADYDALGLKLIANVSGLLTFIDPANLGDVRFEQGIGIPNEELEIDFTIQSATSGKDSRVATYHLIPWENVNLKTNHVLSGGIGGTGDNPITGFSITGVETKTATITLADNTTLVATFEDISSGVGVDDLNIRPNRVKIANIGGVQGVELFETLTALVNPTLVNNILTLKYRNENNIVQAVDIDLSGIIPPSSPDTTIDRIEWDATNTNTINIYETNGALHQINLSKYNITTAVNANGTINILQGGVNKITISKVAQTGSYNDLLNKPVIPAEVVVNDTNTNIDKHKIGDVKGTDLFETVTALITPTLTGNILTLKYRNENDVEQSVTVDLSGIIVNDINVDDLAYNAATNILTLTETDGTPHSIDLSEFSIIVVTNPDGSVDLQQEGITKVTISKVGLTGSYNDLLNKPSIPDQDNELKIYEIPLTELSATPTDNNIQLLVAEWFNTKGFLKTEIQTIGWKITGEATVYEGYVEPVYVEADYVL